MQRASVLRQPKTTSPVEAAIDKDTGRMRLSVTPPPSSNRKGYSVLPSPQKSPGTPPPAPPPPLKAPPDWLAKGASSSPCKAKTSNSFAHEDKAAESPRATKEIEVVSNLGRGTFGKTVMGRRKKAYRQYTAKQAELGPKTNDVIAIKTIKKNETRDILFLALLGDFHHPFLLPTLWRLETRDHIHQATELCAMPIDELVSCISDRGGLGSNDALFYLAEIALGLNYIHSKNVFHLNLKPANILITRSGHVALADMFGFNHLSSSIINYASPERLSKGHEQLGPPADWWALGVIAYQLLSGKLPFSHKEPRFVFTNILKLDPDFHSPCFLAAFSKKQVISTPSPKSTEEKTHFFTEQAKKFSSSSPSNEAKEAIKSISGLLTKDVNTRLGTESGLQDIKQAPWFRRVAWDDTLRKLQPPPHTPTFLLYDSPADDENASNLSPACSPCSTDRPFPTEDAAPAGILPLSVNTSV